MPLTLTCAAFALQQGTRMVWPQRGMCTCTSCRHSISAGLWALHRAGDACSQHTDWVCWQVGKPPALWEMQ